mgnify:CR=1 FL=1
MAIRGSISTNAVSLKEAREAARSKRYHPQIGDVVYAMRLGKRFHVIPEPAMTVCGIRFGGAFFVIHGIYPDAFAGIKPEHMCEDCFPRPLDGR